MTGAYAAKLCVPDGFPEVLREFTREVLRDQFSNPVPAAYTSHSRPQEQAQRRQTQSQILTLVILRSA